MLYHTGRTSHDKFWPDFKNTLIKFTFSDQPITIALLHFKDPLIHAQCISKYKKFWKRKDTPFPQKTAGFYDHVYMGKCYDMWQGFLNFCFVFFFFLTWNIPDPDDPEYIKNLQRPAEVKEDLQQMENRSRVSLILNSQAFKDELEQVVEEQLRNGPYPASLIALQQITDLLLPHSRVGLGSLARGIQITCLFCG